MNQPAKLSKTGITGWRRVTASDLRTSTENSPRSVRRKPARLPSFALPKLRLAASSVPYSPAAKAEQPDADRVPAPVPRQPAKALQAAWFDAAECFETDPIGVATERLPPEWVTHFCCSISADLSG